MSLLIWTEIFTHCFLYEIVTISNVNVYIGFFFLFSTTKIEEFILNVYSFFSFLFSDIICTHLDAYCTFTGHFPICMNALSLVSVML